ncbi:DUF3566 domain-containing protein [Parasphingorhabdus pacifica]
MTPSDKPERSDSSPQQQEANQASVMTESTEDSTDTRSADTSAADGNGESEADTTTSASSASDGDDTAQAEAPPPWQRTAVTTDGESPSTPQGSTDPASSSSTRVSGAQSVGAQYPGAESERQSPADAEQTQTIPKQGQDAETVRTELPKQPSGQDGRVNFGLGARSGASGSATTGRRPSRGPRRASLQIKRLDPWSVLKLALVLSVALFFVWMIAVAVLYGVLDGMGVWDQLNGTFSDLTQPQNTASDPIISAGRVFGVASIVGAINIVLFTALATVAAFIYNVAADFAGGVEVTLSERE